MINGVRYNTEFGDFTVFATLPKRLYSEVASLNCREIQFKNHTYGTIRVFRNRKGVFMVSVSGQFYGFNDRLHAYLIERRADVTGYFKNL